MTPDRVPQYHELFNPTLAALRSLGGSASIRELDDAIASELNLTPEILEIPHGTTGKSELSYRAAWARTYLKIFGLLENSARGVWALTPEGARTTSVDPAEIVRAVRARSRLPRPPEGEPGGEELAEEESDWRADVLRVLSRIAPSAFERLCQRMLRESGFIEVEVTRASGDGGIDGFGTIRVGGLISFNVLFQSKRYQGNIGPDIVREFRGAMSGRADKGLLITTGGFTREARREATRDGAPPIDLIDGDLLVDKLKELGLGVKVEMIESVTVDEAWFNSL